MSFIEIAIAAVESKFADLKVIRRKRQDRIMSSYSEANNKLAPNEDCHGRLHAPCDGYEDVDGRGVYGKGEYLPIPESVFEALAMEGITCDRGQKEYGLKTRVMIETGENDMQSSIFRSFGLGCSFGKSFVRDGVALNYMYVNGNDALVKAIEAAMTEAKEAEKAERRAMKGEAPEGKQTLHCRIVFIRPHIPMSVYDHGSDKMMVEFDNKSTAWGTLPKALAGSEIGTEFDLAATFKRAEDDHTHAFFSRPSVK